MLKLLIFIQNGGKPGFALWIKCIFYLSYKDPEAGYGVRNEHELKEQIQQINDVDK